MEATDSFGYWVRRQRKALDLTQAQLALRVGCASITLRKIEADERFASPQLANRLADALALRGLEHDQFVARAARRLFIPTPTPPLGSRTMPRNLPAPVTTFVGRDRELASVIEFFSEAGARLLTLTGPVGVGKSRLALEAGRRLLPAFLDGVFLIPLATVPGPQDVPQATMTALGVRDLPGQPIDRALVEFLKSRNALLIFDNFEHVLPAASLISDLLAQCSGVSAVVTSTMRLRLYGEHEMAVRPLPLPDPDDPRGGAASPSVLLFSQRAQAAQSSFRLSPSHTLAVAEIVRRLDGLPLAIELAAAQIRLFSPQELRARLEHRLPLLNRGPIDAPPRLQSLQGAIGWTLDQLTTEQRALFAQLAVFAGGFTIEAADAVCEGGDGMDVAGGLSALLDHSLLDRQPVSDAYAGECCAQCPARQMREVIAAEPRFAMIGVLREYGRAMLARSGELNRTEQSHAAHFVAWVEHVAPRLMGPHQHLWLARLDRDADNLRMALRYLLRTDALEPAARLACALGQVWQRQGRYSEGREWMEQVLSRMETVPVTEVLRARALQVTGMLTYRQGHWHSALAELDRSLALFRSASDRSGIARVLFDLGWIALDQGDPAKALTLNKGSRDLAREAGDVVAEYRATTNLGWAHLILGQHDTAGTLFDEALVLARQAEHTRGVAVSLVNLGWIAVYRSNLTRAAELVRDSLRLCHMLGEREVLAEGLEILALARSDEGDMPSAAKLAGAADAIWESLQIMRPPTHQFAVKPLMTPADLRERLSTDELSEAWSHGYRLGKDGAVAFALHGP